LHITMKQDLRDIPGICQRLIKGAHLLDYIF
jgi:hypothetical protein